MPIWMYRNGKQIREMDSMPGDVIHEAKQESWIDYQFNLFSYLPPVKKITLVIVFGIFSLEAHHHCL